MKFVSPGRDGVADRIVLMPGGRIWFVELKTPGKKLRPLQVKFKELVEGLGFQHRVVDSLESLNAFLAEADQVVSVLVEYTDTAGNRAHYEIEQTNNLYNR